MKCSMCAVWKRRWPEPLPGGEAIVNDGKATASDVLSLIDVVKQRVKSARGIELETEVEILGEG